MGVMKMQILLMGAAVCILCLISFGLMQKELYPKEKETVTFREMFLPLSVKRACYFGAMLILNAALVCFFIYFYKEQNLIYILKRVGLAVFICGIMPIDLKNHRIPNLFVLAVLALRIFCLLGELIWYRDILVVTVLQEIIGAAVFFVIIGLCMVIAKNSIGMGDLKLVLVMAACQGIYGVMNTLFVSMIIAFFAALCLLITKKKERKDVIAFAPCIMAGLYVSLFLTGI